MPSCTGKWLGMEWSFAALPSPVQDMQLADHTKNET